MWLAFPLPWTGLTLVRGSLDGWYPYPFLNPVNGGYGTVAVTVVAVTIGFGLDRRGDDRDREYRGFRTNGGHRRARRLTGNDALGLLDSSTRELEAARTHGARQGPSESEVRQVDGVRSRPDAARVPADRQPRADVHAAHHGSRDGRADADAAQGAARRSPAGYLVLGRDLVPDDWPIIGGLDDLVVVVLAAELFLDGVPDDLLNESSLTSVSTGPNSTRCRAGPALDAGAGAATIRRVPELIGGISEA